MSALMPQGQQRTCIAVGCGRSWFTAFAGKTGCPFCGVPQPDVTHRWPHVCARGHGATGGGDCRECREGEAPR